jgi:hypothetical protein
VERAKKVGDPRRGQGKIPFLLRFYYKAAIEKAEAAQREGRKYGLLYDDDLTSHDLESEFSYISRKFLKKDLYYGEACLFDCFTSSQKRCLLYIVSKMSRTYQRRKRHRIAVNTVTPKDVRRVLKDRAIGTYRVEKDPTVIRISRGCVDLQKAGSGQPRSVHS